MSANIETKYTVTFAIETTGYTELCKHEFLADAIAYAYDTINAGVATVAAIVGDNTHEAYAAVTNRDVVFFDTKEEPFKGETFCVDINAGKAQLFYAAYGEDPEESGAYSYAIETSLFEAINKLEYTDYMATAVFKTQQAAETFIKLERSHIDNESFFDMNALPFDPFHMDYVKQCAAEWRK